MNDKNELDEMYELYFNTEVILGTTWTTRLYQWNHTSFQGAPQVNWQNVFSIFYACFSR